MPFKPILFDFMGTCFDWHSNVFEVFPSTSKSDRASDPWLRWGQQYFDLNKAHVEAGQTVEAFNVTLARAFDYVLNYDFSHLASHFDAEARVRESNQTILSRW
jgi:FMN phosphatase YigB (HAD superfamily)